MKESSEERTKAHSLKTNFNFGIRGRLFTGFGILAVILLIAVVLVLMRVNMTEDVTKNVIDRDLPQFSTAYDLNIQVLLAQAAIHRYALTKHTKFKDQLTRAWGNITRAEAKLDSYFKDSSAINRQWQEVKTGLNQLKSTQMELLALSENADAAAVGDFVDNKLYPVTNHLFELLDGSWLLSGERKQGLFNTLYFNLNTHSIQVLNDMHSIRMTQITLMIGIVILSALIAIVTANKIIRPLHSAIKIAKKIARGERRIKIHVGANDETGQLLRALDKMQLAIADNEKKLQKSEAHTRDLFDRIVKIAKAYSEHTSNVAAGNLKNRIDIQDNNEMKQLGKDLNAMTDSLMNITGKITEACHNMVSTMEEVKSTVDIQSSGVTEQASSINEITASLEEIEKSSLQTIAKAKTLGEIAARTREKGQVGLEAVQQSVLGMRSVREKVQTIAQTILDLSNQTQQVGEITAVVNTLAQQSKMLALNASIEAAKAGEAGKGFAVVAAEVKNLAEQSENSTAQVQKILEDIKHATEKAVMATEEGTKGVDQGVDLVEQTGEIVRSLSEVIHETTIASQQIEAAIQQEGIGIEQITAGMSEINEVTSSFVESVKQSNEAISNLSVIAKNLKEHVDIYKT